MSYPIRPNWRRVSRRLLLPMRSMPTSIATLSCFRRFSVNNARWRCLRGAMSCENTCSETSKRRFERLDQLEPFEPFLPSVQSALDGRYKCNRIAERYKSVLDHTQIVALRFPRQSLKYRLRPALKPLLTFLSAKESFFLHQRLEPRTYLIDLVFKFLEPGEKILAFGIEDEKWIDDAFFGNIHTQRIFSRQFLKLVLPFAGENPIEKNLSGVSVWRRGEKRRGIGAGADRRQSFEMDRRDGQSLGGHTLAFDSAERESKLSSGDPIADLRQAAGNRDVHFAVKTCQILRAEIIADVDGIHLIARATDAQILGNDFAFPFGIQQVPVALKLMGFDHIRIDTRRGVRDGTPHGDKFFLRIGEPELAFKPSAGVEGFGQNEHRANGLEKAFVFQSPE